MPLTSPLFLLLLLPAVLLYFLLPRKCGPFVLLSLSLLYCASWGIWMLLPIAWDFAVCLLFSFLIEKAETEKKKRAANIAAQVLLFGALIAFKGMQWLRGGADGLFGSFSFEWNILLPVGISFYTLQASAYLTDIRRKETERERNPLSLALFLSYFPQLVSGPISRANVLLPAFRGRAAWDADGAVTSFKRILFGLFEKIAVADLLGRTSDAMLSSPETAGGPAVLIGIMLYSLRILCDFRGYSHLAIGVSGLFGIRLPENFNDPYGAYSVSEFWRRWHITLSEWIRDYLYFPLGGSRVGVPRFCLNILICFLFSGLWHGAGLNFLVWGLLHAVFRIVERIIFRRKKPANPASRAVRSLCTFLAVTFAWIFFRSPSLSDAGHLLHGLMNGSVFTASAWTSVASAAGFGSLAWVLPACALLLFAVYRLLLPRLKGKLLPCRYAVYVLMLWTTAVACILLHSEGVSSAFIYMQF